MITSAQMRSARALLGIDQRRLAELAGVFPKGHALDRAGIELIGDNAVSTGGGRGVRLKQPPPGYDAS